MGRRKIKSGATVQFRPGEQLGQQLDSFAGAFQLSRNEAARRLVHLAIRRIPIDLYPLIAELQSLMTEPCDFADACHELVVAVTHTQSESAQLTAKYTVDELTWAALQRIQLLRELNDVTKEAETVRVHVYVTRGGQ